MNLLKEKSVILKENDNHYVMTLWKKLPFRFNCYETSEKQSLEVLSVTMAKTLTFEKAFFLIKENRTVEDAILTQQNQVIETKTVKMVDFITATQALSPGSFTMAVKH